MTEKNKNAIVSALLEEYGESFSDELGMGVEKNTPSPLFRLLCFSILASARIGSPIAVRAAKALVDKGWTTPQKMAESTWRQRVTALNRAGYARYDESTSRMFGDTCAILLDKYGGDLRRLRDAAGKKPDEERRLLKEFKGIGDVGADIFIREVQIVWSELLPFADKKALQASEKLGLGTSADSLWALVSRKDYTRLVGALVRCDLDQGYEKITKVA